MAVWDACFNPYVIEENADYLLGAGVSISARRYSSNV